MWVSCLAHVDGTVRASASRVFVVPCVKKLFRQQLLLVLAVSLGVVAVVVVEVFVVVVFVVAVAARDRIVGRRKHTSRKLMVTRTSVTSNLEYTSEH